MTTRIDQPDTDADLRLRRLLDERPVRSFIVTAGAGSGKTTSLVKALSHLAQTRATRLRVTGQKIACITYTDVAVREISSDVGNSALVHVSTIHSFLWVLISPLQTDIRNWVLSRLQEKILDVQAKLNNPRTRSREKYEGDLARYRRQAESIENIERFTYGVGSDYSRGILGHEDVLKIGPELIRNRPLMQRIVAARFPVIFVDESQDTNPEFVAALEAIDAANLSDFCLGFFGDPMQKIYLVGAGAIQPGQNWVQIDKPENFRCSTTVLTLINKIRSEQDGLQQTRGRVEIVDGVIQPVAGSVRLFILPADERRTARIADVRSWLAQTTGDPLWVRDDNGASVRVLVLVHRMAANRLGFGRLYSSLHDRSTDGLKKGIVDGTAWPLRPFLRYLLPLARALFSADAFAVMTVLRSSCPRLQKNWLQNQDAANVLAEVRASLQEYGDLMRPESLASVGEVLRFCNDRGLLALDDRFDDALIVWGAMQGETINPGEIDDPLLRFLFCPVVETWGYLTYIEQLSPFATQQGVKGAEFERVMVILDDEESDYKLFSYEKYFGIEPLSEVDVANQEAGIDSVVDRTARLFYVCCSRARRDLVVTLFVDDVNVACSAILEHHTFSRDQILTLNPDGGFTVLGPDVLIDNPV